MPNRLAAASSPYLLQHRENPVDWFEWGEDAFAAARHRDRPVLLSVGYSACHWCHVMAHESFEDEATAAFMNEHFVNVKVDREERPDVDRIYMDAVQAMTGRGGWPMTVFLTPTGEPFFAGTYFPREALGHHPSFMTVLTQVTRAWDERREDLEAQAERLTAAVRSRLPAGDVPPAPAMVSAALGALAEAHDPQHGGFGGAPKFPQPAYLELLLRALALDLDPARSLREMLVVTLDRMAAGGIYDHLGGGFARYSVDERWLVPHFEKMLYDNALLARVYLRAWQLTGSDSYRTVATETLDYLLRDLRHPEGGLFSAEDADSEGVEGKYYVWTWDELTAAVPGDAALLATLYGASPGGNFEGANILHRADDLAAVAARLDTSVDEVVRRKGIVDDTLRTARGHRVRPGLDDKVITAWNGLALRAFAEAGAVLGDARYLDAARGIARFVGERLIRHGRLFRSWRDGNLSVPGFCDDYGAMAVGLFTLFAATGEQRWYAEARRLTHEMNRLFADPGGGFFATGDDAEELIARPANYLDNPAPSDNALAAEALLLLTSYSGERWARDSLAGIGDAAGRLLASHPHAAAHLVAVLAVAHQGIKEVAIVGEPSRRDDLEAVVWETFRPDCVLAPADGPSTDIPLLAGRSGGAEGAQAYVCREFVCAAPVATAPELRAAIGAA
jgi:uncharacterized protein YyaL (SSP411 family)